MGKKIPNQITLLHPTDNFDVKTEFKDQKIILHITYSDGTKIMHVTENNTMTVHVLNRDFEILPDGKTARIIKP